MILMMWDFHIFLSLRMKHEMSLGKRNRGWRRSINQGLDQALRGCQIPKGLKIICHIISRKQNRKKWRMTSLELDQIHKRWLMKQLRKLFDGIFSILTFYSTILTTFRMKNARKTNGEEKRTNESME